jgi:hypothetical protein
MLSKSARARIVHGNPLLGRRHRGILVALALTLTACSADIASDAGLELGGATHTPDEAKPRVVACTSGPETSSRAAVQRCGAPKNRVNLVFIGDGYTTEGLSLWAAHVDGLWNEIQTTAAPYARYRNFINVYRVDIESKQTGIDDPDKGIFVDTALDGTNSCIDWMMGLCQVDWKKTHAAIDAGMEGIPVHWRLVGLHTHIFLGATHYPPEGTLAVYATDVPEAFNIATHEGGHGFHGLGDEYVVDTGKDATYTDAEPNWPNLTKDPTGSKWKRWQGFAEPDLGGPVGAYEGGMANYGKGIYRPSPQSRMNAFTHELDAIGKESAIRSIYAHVHPVDEHLPNASAIQGCEPPWLHVVDPEVIKLQWFVDGVRVEGASAESLDLCRRGVPSGTHVVRARAYDEVLDHAFSDNTAPHPLDLVREGAEALEESVEWTVTIP